MSVQELIRDGMIKAFKGGHKETCDNLKYILGEFKRLKGIKDGKVYIGNTLTDEQAIKVINGIIKEEKKLNNILGRQTSAFLELLNSYLPAKIGEEEITEWINYNVDFSQLKNKMQAIGLVKKHFGVAVDGKMVSDIIKNWR